MLMKVPRKLGITGILPVMKKSYASIVGYSVSDLILLIVLMAVPSNHEVLKRLVAHFHFKNCHAGFQILLNLLTKKYWIMNERRTVTSVLSKCINCKRFNSKYFEYASVSLCFCFASKSSERCSCV